MTPYRIALLDDHAIVRMGYRRLLELEPGLQVVAEYADATPAWHDLVEPATAEHRTRAVDLLLLDLSLPGRSGLDFLRELRTRRPALKVLVVSMHDSPTIRQQCLRAGADGTVAKSDDPRVLVDAVRRLQSGWHLPASEIVRREQRRPPHERLTMRESQVLQHLLAGCSVEQAAARMGLAGKTVFNHQTHLRQKLAVDSTVALLHYAQVHGLVPE